MGDDPRRIFVVGCPRSGTTLLQSMLAAHPDVHAFPETHALYGVRSGNPVGRMLGLRSRAARKTWERLPALGVPVMGGAPWRVATLTQRFVAGLDRAAEQAGKSAWSEKTPGHLRALPLIASEVPDAKVVHIVRDGVAAVTSLYAVTQEHAEGWSGSRSLELCLTRWRNDLGRTVAAAGRPGQIVVSYERLVDDPRAVLSTLTEALDLDDDGTVLDGVIDTYRASARQVSGVDEPWKHGVARAPLQDRRHVHDGMLTDEQLEYVTAEVAKVASIREALRTL